MRWLLGCVVFLVGCVSDAPVVTDGGTDAPADNGASDSSDSGSSLDSADAAMPSAPELLDQKGELAVWLEASSANITIVNNAVGIWKDLSKNHNDAKCPTMCPSVDKGALAGRDAVRFDDIPNVVTIDDAASLRFGTDDFFLIAVASTTAVDGHGWLWSKASYGPCMGSCPYLDGFEVWLNGNVVDAGGMGVAPSARIAPNSMQANWGDPVFDDGKFHRIAVRRSNAGFALSIQVDDIAPRNTPQGQFDISTMGTPVKIGGEPFEVGVRPPIHMDLAELIVVYSKGGLVADQTVLDLEKYFKGKYSL